MKALAVGVLTFGVVVGGGYAVSRAVNGVNGSDTARVVRVIDGDTVDVESNGKSQRVRLLNIDTPETKHPDKAVQCLGPEATEFLRRVLSPGDTVRLTYDVDRVDGYGRTLAAVSKNGSDVSTAIADAGYGVAIKVGANARFYQQVKEGEDRARKAARGLFADDVECTLPVKLDALEAQLGTLPTTPAAEADLDIPLGVAAAVAADADALSATLAAIKDGGEATRVWRLAYRLPDLEKRVAAVSRSAERSHQKLSQESTKRAKAAAAARKKTEVEEAARKKRAAEEAATKKRAEREAAEKASRESESRRREARQREMAPRTTTWKNTPPTTQQRRPTPTTRPAPAPPRTTHTKSSQRKVTPKRTSEQAPKTKYTGPRCYAPGGKTWKPCPSKGG